VNVASGLERLVVLNHGIGVCVCVCVCPDEQCGKYNYVRFEVLTASSMKTAVFWVAAPCSLVEVYQRIRGAYSLHHRGVESTSTRLHEANNTDDSQTPGLSPP
jgi:hypothetical protein